MTCSIKGTPETTEEAHLLQDGTLVDRTFLLILRSDIVVSSSSLLSWKQNCETPVSTTLQSDHSNSRNNGD